MAVPILHQSKNPVLHQPKNPVTGQSHFCTFQTLSKFVFGHSVQAGIVDAHPSLEKLNDGDLAFHTDFRQVYATMLEKWLGVNSAAILGKKYGLLPLVG